MSIVLPTPSPFRLYNVTNPPSGRNAELVRALGSKVILASLAAFLTTVHGLVAALLACLSVCLACLPDSLLTPAAHTGDGGGGGCWWCW